MIVLLRQSGIPLQDIDFRVRSSEIMQAAANCAAERWLFPDVLGEYRQAQKWLLLYEAALTEQLRIRRSTRICTEYQLGFDVRGNDSHTVVVGNHRGQFLLTGETTDPCVFHNATTSPHSNLWWCCEAQGYIQTRTIIPFVLIYTEQSKRFTPLPVDVEIEQNGAGTTLRVWLDPISLPTTQIFISPSRA